VSEDLEVLEEPVVYEDKAIAARLTYNPERDTYRVEYAPLLQDGGIGDEWGIFGGTVGYTSSSYDSQEDAREFFDDLEDIPSDEILDHFAVGENPE
jgi:hypothetical protein